MGKKITYPGEMPTPFFAQWRIEKGWTQGEVVERLAMIGVDASVGQISRFETGEVHYSQDILHALAHVHGCKPEDLLTINPLAPKDVPRLTYNVLKNASAEIQEQAYRYVTDFLMKKAG
jgi:transcriptional regulator with XRE-family HTH domain